MKNFLTALALLFSFAILAEESTVTISPLIDSDPKAGVIYTLCIEGYKFAIFRNHQRISSINNDDTQPVRTYLGESQSSSMVQIINDRGHGIKCPIK